MGIKFILMSDKKTISKQEIEKVAKLARINLTEPEKEKFSRELSDVLDNFKELSQLDLSEADVEKVKHLEIEENQVRQDEIIECSEKEKENIRGQFPDRKDDYLKVKAVL